MLHLIPPPLHRLLLRVAHRARVWVRKLTKRRLEGVSLIALDREGRVLLVRHSYGSGRWALPGGGCQRTEDPAAAIRREMREELAVELSDLEKIAMLEEVLWDAPHIAHIFAARLQVEPVPDGREIVDARFFARGSLPADLSALSEARLAKWLDREG